MGKYFRLFYCKAYLINIGKRTHHGVYVRGKIAFKLLEGRSPRKKTSGIISEFGKDLHFFFKNINDWGALVA